MLRTCRVGPAQSVSTRRRAVEAPAKHTQGTQMQFIAESYRYMADRPRGSFPCVSESRQPARDHLKLLRGLRVAAVFVACALQPGRAEARGPSTREERARFIALVQALERDPLAADANAIRAGALRVRICTVRRAVNLVFTARWRCGDGRKCFRKLFRRARGFWLVGGEKMAAHHLHLDISNYPAIGQQVFTRHFFV